MKPKVAGDGCGERGQGRAVAQWECHTQGELPVMAHDVCDVSDDGGAFGQAEMGGKALQGGCVSSGYD